MYKTRPTGKLIGVNPINILYAGHLAKVLGIMRDDSQVIMTGCNSDKDVKITNNDSFTGEILTNLCIIPSPITKGQNSKGLFNLLRFLQMLFYGLTMKRAINQFGYTYLRGIDLFCWSFLRYAFLLHYDDGNTQSKYRCRECNLS